MNYKIVLPDYPRAYYRYQNAEVTMEKSIGKLRGLQQLSGDLGILTVCAIDHRGSLRHALNPQNPGAVSYQDMVDFKLDLCRVLSSSASAMLLDPEYGASQAIAAGALSGHTGLIVSLEATGYSGNTTSRATEILPDWGVSKIKMMGASAVKLLIYFRYDLKKEAQKQFDLVARIAEQCAYKDIPLLVEAVSYPLEQETSNPLEYSKKKPELVIEAARRLTALPFDILKSEFPADISYEKDEGKMKTYCRELSSSSQLPWVLLSAGASYDVFKQEVRIACQSGASGFMAGRALWQEACSIKSRWDRSNFLSSTTLIRIRDVAGIAIKYGKPWYSKMGVENAEFTSIAEGWYRSYRQSN